MRWADEFKKMFLFFFSLSLITLSSVRAGPLKEYEELPKEYKELLPPQARQFLAELSENEKIVLKEVAKNYQNYKNEEEVLEALKEKSPSLHEKAEKLHNILKEKIASLGEEAQMFVKEVIVEARKLQAAVVAGTRPSLPELKNKALDAVRRYQVLSNASKEELRREFPVLTAIFTNERFKKLADSLLEKERKKKEKMQLEEARAATAQIAE